MTLALFGGPPVISEPLPPYRAMGPTEKAAVAEVMDSGCLSGFVGSPGPGFLGGPKVRAFEEAWAKHCGVKHAVSVNSATSGLIAAMGAIELRPGDEVIVPPWTMSATVAAVLHYGGVPVFADIEADTFCIDPEAEKKITPRTKAIIAVNLFGHPAKLAELRAMADEYGIHLIEDSAQAPLAFENGKRAGTVGDIGVFSFNYHKHIHTGEGGMCVTNDDRLAERLRLLRNHGENLGGGPIGFNFRMTEIQAAIGIVQLTNIEEHVGQREKIADALTKTVVTEIGVHYPRLDPPRITFGCRSNFYLWAFRYHGNATLFSAALAAEGFPHTLGYVKPLYRLFRRGAITEVCPVAESLGNLMLFETCAYDVSDEITAKLCEALRKVYDQRDKL